MYTSLLNEQRHYFLSGATKSYEFRMKQLELLKAAIKKYEEDITIALAKDLGKSDVEAYSTEIGFIYEEMNYLSKHLKNWMKPTKVKAGLLTFGSKNYIFNEAYGVSLIIAPWNYPFQLAIAPLLGAIIGGNTAVLKPSELTPNVSQILKKLIDSTFPKHYIAVVEGGVPETTELLQLQWDKIFFTGSVPVGKIVMKAAAQFITPLTLELGGKSPTIVNHDASIELAAKRICFGKFMNAGQTCIAPDYVLVHEDVYETFIEEMKKTIQVFYGNSPLTSNKYGRIVSEKHWERLISFITKENLIHGGTSDRSTLKIEPTLLRGDNEASVMQEEIFGPLLPIFKFHSLDDVIKTVRSRPKPLALYYFGNDSTDMNRIIDECSFGGGTMNDTVMHLTNPRLPFGGVSESGMGSYHGYYSFLAFTHQKSITKQPTIFDASIRYPNSEHTLKWLKRIFK